MPFTPHLPARLNIPQYVIVRDDDQSIVPGYESPEAGALAPTAYELAQEIRRCRRCHRNHPVMHEVVDIAHRHNEGLLK